ncbi:MAG: hypothetical protein DWQ07_09015 [Chloroflexi bacterium]|nr:MAG: hypothetical protein DWQ07_09015 [Chloroflexota bacterium]MBL1193147.1 hypothetical protein [Chloroflexota bacterium]NOH10440.1 glycosyltransferase [Chloroflexota bacterium]
MKGKRLLVVSWSLPPLLGPRSIQVGRTLKQLAANGWDCTVLSVDTDSLPANYAKDNFLAEHYLQNYQVIRVPAPPWLQLLNLVRRILPQFAPMPDNQTIWVKPVLAKVEALLFTNTYDAVLTFGHPWSDHLIGLEIKRKWQIPWVAHFSDPWADNPYYFRLSNFQKAQMETFERSVIEAADMVVFTNSETADLVFKKYPAEWKTKAQVVPHGYDRNLLGYLKKNDFREGVLRIIHTGNLYGLRTPQGILEALRLLKEEGKLNEGLDIVFLGRTKNREDYIEFCKRHGIEVVKFMPTLPYLESLQIAASADVLLLIDAPAASSSVFLPSKLVDYMMFGKPILGLTPNDGVVALLLDEFGFPHSDPQDEKRIAEMLLGIWDKHNSRGFDFSQKFDSVAERFDIEYTTGTFETLLGAVIAG